MLVDPSQFRGSSASGPTLLLASWNYSSVIGGSGQNNESEYDKY